MIMIKISLLLVQLKKKTNVILRNKKFGNIPFVFIYSLVLQLV